MNYTNLMRMIGSIGDTRYSNYDFQKLMNLVSIEELNYKYQNSTSLKEEEKQLDNYLDNLLLTDTTSEISSL